MHGNNGRRNYNYLHGQSLLSSINPPVNEGYQVDIQSTTRIQVLELLERQEKLLANQSFLQNLPDGGEKIRRKVGQLRERLSDLDKENESIREIPEYDKTTTTTATTTADSPMDEGENAEEDALDRGDLESSPKKEAMSEDMNIVERGFSSMLIHEGPFYEVVKNASKKKNKSKFVLNRKAEKESPPKPSPKINISSSSAPPANVGTPGAAVSSKSNSEGSGRLAKIISVDECRTLHAQQQAIIKEQQAVLSAERLLARYGHSVATTTSGDFDSHPEGHFRHEEVSDAEDVEVTHMEDAMTDLNEVD